MSVGAKEFLAVKRANNTSKKTMTLKNCISLMQQSEYMTEEGVLTCGPMGILSKWSRIEIGFAQVDTKDGATVRSNGTGSIEVSSLEDIYLKTKRIEDKLIDCAFDKPVQASNDKIEELETIINYLPKDMTAGKGMSAIQIAKTFSIPQVLTAAKNLETQAANGGKFAKMNQSQADALQIALIVANRDKDFIKPTIAESFTADQATFLKACAAYYNSHERNDEGCLYIETMNKLLKAKKIDSRVFRVNAAINNDGGYIELYESFKTPNVHKVDAEGYTKAYEIKISANPKKDYPYRVELTTMLGKPRTDRNGDVQAVGIDASDVKDKKQFVMDLNSREWTNAIYMMVAMRDQMVAMGFKDAYILSSKLEYQAAAEARATA